MTAHRLPPEVLHTGQPTPFALHDANGALLAGRGMLIETDAQRQQLTSRELFLGEQDGETFFFHSC